MVQVAKTAVTPSEEFAEQHIQKVNDDWGTPLWKFRWVGTRLGPEFIATLRKFSLNNRVSITDLSPSCRMYQEANLSLNMFILDSTFLFSYAWCIGVDTVTTNNCQKLSGLKHNNLYQVASTKSLCNGLGQIIFAAAYMYYETRVELKNWV